MLQLLVALAPLAGRVALAAPNHNVVARAGVTVTVNLDTTYQTMAGFGFSEAFGRANDLYNLPATQRTNALDLLFSTTKGAGMTILRNRIGSGGSGDSIEPTSPGSPSATPKYVWDGSDSHQVWVSQQAMTYGVKTFYADAWSAPGFMKTNGNQANGGYLCGVSGKTCSSGDWKQAYANFLVQYVKYYASVGVPITHLGFLNEPEYAATYSGMLSSGTQAADFIKVLAPTVKAAGLNVGLACCDSEGWNNQVTMTQQLIAAGVENDLAVITSHSYVTSPTSPINTKLPVWETEYADLDDAFSAAWYSNGAQNEGMTWAQKIYTAIVNARCSAYLYWEGIEQGTTSSTLITISGTTVTASKRLWAFAQWSRYVRPGAVRVGTTGSGTGLQFSAFKNTDGTVSVQVLNSATSAQVVNVATSSGFVAQSVVAHITDNSNDIGTLSASISNGQASASVPSRSMVTFVLSGKAGQSPTSTAGPTSSSSTPASTTTSATPPSGSCAALYDQCGGLSWTGATCCSSGTCTVGNPYYSQCT